MLTSCKSAYFSSMLYLLKPSSNPRFHWWPTWIPTLCTALLSILICVFLVLVLFSFFHFLLSTQYIKHLSIFLLVTAGCNATRVVFPSLSTLYVLLFLVSFSLSKLYLTFWTFQLSTEFLLRIWTATWFSRIIAFPLPVSSSVFYFLCCSIICVFFPATLWISNFCTSMIPMMPQVGNKLCLKYISGIIPNYEPPTNTVLMRAQLGSLRRSAL